MYDSIVIHKESVLPFPHSISLEDKIGGGRHREVYRYCNLAVKVLKPYVVKDYGLFSIATPTKLFSLYKVGSLDLNRVEYENYQKLISQVPEGVMDSFAKIFEISGNEGESISIGELVVNSNGTLSQTLEQYGGVKSPRFWERIKDLEQLFLSKDIPYFDIRPKNILVKEFENRDSIPVLVDYDAIGTRAFLFQINLLLKSERARKIKRRFSRIREKYKLD